MSFQVVWLTLKGMDYQGLISAAEGVLRPLTVRGRLFGDVGAAIVSGTDRLFLGVSVDTPSWGLCAERNALAAMITSGEYKFKKAVTIWKEPTSGSLYILPPCGVCREFMRCIDETNLDSEIILGINRVALLRDLLPEHAWPKPMIQDRIQRSEGL